VTSITKILGICSLAAIASLSACGKDTASTSSATTRSAAPAQSNAKAQTYDVAGADHVKGAVSYPQTPPVGGDHNPVWQTCGAYAEPIESEKGVHSMEHGAVWITYRPDLPAAEIQTLRALAEQGYVLVSPYPGLPAPIVASAWGKQLSAESANDAGIVAFVQEFRQGPQTPEPGAICTNGFGRPL
jgi:hypothetical protein